jgi:two-component system alkaline phosphatase synthesis response regulator PhoP
MMRTSQPPHRILLVEDEPGLVLTLTDLLTSEGYFVEAACDGLEGLDRACGGEFDLIILDIMLPGKNGFDVCRDLRREGILTPLLMLTARGQVIDKVLGLKLGADDYLTKPFEPLELLARVEALLRRIASPPPARLGETFQFGSVAVDFISTEVRRNGVTISRQQLLRDVWAYDRDVLTRTVDVHVGVLRQKLEDDAKNPRHFLTVRGFGYKFVDQAE